MWVTDLELDGEVKDVFGVGNSAIDGEGLKFSEGGNFWVFCKEIFSRRLKGSGDFLHGNLRGFLVGFQGGFVGFF